MFEETYGFANLRIESIEDKMEEKSRKMLCFIIFTITGRHTMIQTENLSGGMTKNFGA